MFRILVMALSALCLAWGQAERAHAASMVVAADSGHVLQADDADVLWYPASLTKLMTVLLAFEALRAGDLELSTVLTVSKTAAAQPPTSIGLKAGETLSLDTAISATILRSANDAAVVLAEALAANEEEFAARMTARARELGMVATVFRNATGLPHREQVTTARDMAVLARHLIREMPDYLGYFDDRSLTIGSRRLPSINGFLTNYAGAFGLKTGFTCASGYNLVASATRDGRTIIGVLLGAGNGPDRAARIRRLMDTGFRTAAKQDGAPKSLDDYVASAPEKPRGPPTVIPQAECGPKEEAVPASPQVATADESLPGWGILLGSFNARDQAEAAAERSRARLGAAAKGAKAVVLQRHSGRARGFSVLLVGLKREQAQGACSILRQAKAYCLALGPKALNNPRALWR